MMVTHFAFVSHFNVTACFFLHTLPAADSICLCVSRQAELIAAEPEAIKINQGWPPKRTHTAKQLCLTGLKKAFFWLKLHDCILLCEDPSAVFTY